MTREEAISIMNVIIHMLEPQYDNDRVEEAVDMAIKALEQEPVYFPPCVDCNTKMNEIREAYDKAKESECQQDHAILKAHADGANEVLDRIKEAKDAVENINPIYSTIGNRIPVLKNCDDIKTEVLAILDKLIAEVEGKDANERK